MCQLCTELLRSAYILEDTQSRLTSHLIECQTQMLPIVLSAMHIHSEDAALQVWNPVVRVGVGSSADAVCGDLTL